MNQTLVNAKYRNTKNFQKLQEKKKKGTQMLDEPKHMIVKEISSAYEWKAKDLKS